MLREYGHEEQADEVVAKYIEARKREGPEFFNLANHHIPGDVGIDEKFRGAFEERRANFVDTRNPLEVLRLMGARNDWDEADVLLMEKQTVDDFERMFESLRGNDLKRSIDTLLRISDTIRTVAIEALRRIGTKSQMRAEKVRRYGVTPESPEQVPPLAADPNLVGPD